MYIFAQIKNHLLFLLMSSILILCGSFVFISCGSGIGPQLKVENPDSGQFAIDFSQSPAGAALIFFETNDHNPNTTVGYENGSRSIGDTDITIEAWVKSKSADLDGAIFSRMKTRGAILFVKDNIPKFAIRRTPDMGVDGTTRGATLLGCVNLHSTSTECIVNGTGTTLVQNVWTHIAGVLTSENQSTGPLNCNVVGIEQPHLAIYIDGSLVECASSNSLYATNPGAGYTVQSLAVVADGGAEPLDDPNLTIDNPGPPTTYITDGNEIAAAGFDGVIDEVRLWRVARTQAQIQACMNRQLEFDGDCNRSSADLVSYLRFNKGQGHSISDWAGLTDGVKESPSPTPWDGGWVPGFTE